MHSDIVFVIRTATLQGRLLRPLRAELRSLAVAGRRLVLDFSLVERVDAESASLILWAAARVGVGGSLTLVGLRSPVAAFFELLRLHRSVHMQPSQSSPLSAPLAA